VREKLRGKGCRGIAVRMGVDSAELNRVMLGGALASSSSLTRGKIPHASMEIR
jgi:hypothetical protein